MEDYINGCYTKYGTRPLNKLEIKHKGQLSNGMWFVYGFIPTEEDGLSIDVYKDKELKELVFMEHGIISTVDNLNEADSEIFEYLAESRIAEMKLY